MNYEKQMHLKARECPVVSASSCWERERPGRHILTSFTLYLCLLKLTINITSCFACFNNKKEKCFVFVRMELCENSVCL